MRSVGSIKEVRISLIQKILSFSRILREGQSYLIIYILHILLLVNNQKQVSLFSSFLIEGTMKKDLWMLVY